MIEQQAGGRPKYHETKRIGINRMVSSSRAGGIFRTGRQLGNTSRASTAMPVWKRANTQPARISLACGVSSP